MAANNIILRLPKQTSQIILNHVQRRHMPVNVPPTAVGKRRFRLEVETDPHKLVNYCCGLNYIEGSPPVKLKPDNEYPDWLWNLRLGPKKNSWELEKGTKEYYLRLADEGRELGFVLALKAGKVKKIVGKHLLERQRYLHHLRFAALAHMEDDPGLPENATYQDWAHTQQKFRMKASEYYLPIDKSKVIYADKIAGSTVYKQHHRDENNTFKNQIIMSPRPPRTLPRVLDSVRRYPHSYS